MLYLIGAGLHPHQLTLEGLAALKKCQKLYLETYTSQLAKGTLSELEWVTGRKINLLTRRQIEEETIKILNRAKKQDVGLLVFGNPLFATTHLQMLLDARAQNVRAKVVPGISIQNYLGETGLDAYKFGRITTIVYPQKNFAPDSFFDIITQNKRNGLHTLCLLDIQTEQNLFMSISDALTILDKIARQKKSKLLDETILIGLYKIGSSNQIIRTGTKKELMAFKPDLFLQTLIVCGTLNEKEKEALAKLAKKDSNE